MNIVGAIIRPVNCMTEIDSLNNLARRPRLLYGSVAAVFPNHSPIHAVKFGDCRQCSVGEYNN